MADFTAQQKLLLKQAREYLCELVDNPSKPWRLNPMTPEYKEVMEIISLIEALLGY